MEGENAGRYNLVLAGPGLKMERELTNEQGHKLVLWLLGGCSGPLGAGPDDVELNEAGSNGMISGAGKANAEDTSVPTLSVGELVESKDPQRGPEKIATIAYYLSKMEGAETFTVEELRETFVRARLAVPKNLGRDLSWTVRLGLISPKRGERGSYYLTRTGIGVVDEGFTDEWRRKTKGGGEQKRRKPVREETKGEVEEHSE